VRVHISTKQSDLNITTTTTPDDKKRGRRRKSCFAAGERERKVIDGIAACAVCCWCNDVTAIMSHHVHTHMERWTE